MSEGSGGGGPRRPTVAQRRTAARCTVLENRTGYFTERGQPLGSQKSSADLEETGIALIAAARPTATLEPAAQLFIADHRQYCPQPLVVGDGALVDVAKRIEGAVSELDAVVADRQPAIGIIDNVHSLSDRCLGLFARLQDEQHLLVLQSQCSR